VMMGLSGVVEEEECRDSWRDDNVKSAPYGRFSRSHSFCMWSRYLDKRSERQVRSCLEWKAFGAASCPRRFLATLSAFTGEGIVADLEVYIKSNIGLTSDR
jgi:hypothetical protein